jgi:prepilin-type N-terminal cleavage/methylation domain-containing protein
MRKNEGFTIMEILVVIAIFAAMITILMPVVEMTRQRAERINCANNLRIISLGLHMYAAEHNGKFPPDLAALYPTYIKDAKAFDCPSSKTVGTPEKPDYVYIANLKGSSPGSEMIACDADGNHRGKGKNILKVGGSVDWAAQGTGKPR